MVRCSVVLLSFICGARRSSLGAVCVVIIMGTTFYFEFGILFVACLAGSAAVLPYGIRLLKVSGKPLKLSIPKLVLLSVMQGAVIFAIVTGVGLWAAHSIGLGAPYIETMLAGTTPAQPLVSMLQAAIVLGVLGGVILLLADLLF